MKSYLYILTATITLAFAPMMALSAAGIFSCFDCDLLKYQESKIATMTGNVDTVILGDSSIGFAVDARMFSQLSGRNTVSLALTGYNYGIGGAYALLTEVLKRGRPRNVVFALSPQSYALSFAQLEGLPIRGLIQTFRRRPYRVFAFNANVSRAAARALSQELFDRQFLMAGIGYMREGTPPALPADFIKYDYFAPYMEIMNVNNVIESWGTDPTHDYDIFFSRLASVCREYELNCLYLHGTLLEFLVERNRAFIHELGVRIEQSGIKVPYALPVGIPSSEIGNSINHIRPSLQPVYTRKFFDLLDPVLR